MTVLVTGATGLIGSHLVDLLIERGEPVRALVRRGDAVDRLAGQGVEISWGDMADRASLAQAVAGVNRVLHCAARTGPWGPREEYEAANVRGLSDLLELSMDADVRRFVHVSSVIAMGADVRGEADETAKLRVERHNPYSWSKVAGERLINDFIASRQAPVTIVRPGLVYGPRDRGSFGRFASMIQRGRMIQIGSGGNHLPLVYVTDVARGILLASEPAQAVGRTYLLVNDEPVTQKGYFAAIAREMGAPAVRLRVPYFAALVLGEALEMAYRLSRQSRPPMMTRYGAQLLGGENRLSIKRARTELGFSPLVDLEQGVRWSVDWFLGRKSADRQSLQGG